MATMLAGLSDPEWATQSRCAEWTVQGVVAHLVGTNAFWQASVLAGLAGNPTRILGAFDPATTPPMMVSAMSGLAPHEVLEQFISSNESLLDVLFALSDDEWMKPAETPAGHVPIRLLAFHALWDIWIHERDVALPLGLPCVLEDDELASCLRYAAAISPVLAIGFGQEPKGAFAVVATDPDIRFVLEVGSEVQLIDDFEDDDKTPCLHGTAVELVEALSIRTALPATAPAEWRQLLTGLAKAFDTPGEEMRHG
jgi:uncharacterized protein (TIGR03083 family)